ncbi:MAG: oligosaccharide flippase family protein, partial [Dehalococcoidia bacterium]
MKATKRLVGATSGSVLTAFAGQGVLLISGVLAARLLGVEDRGILALFALLATAFGQVGTFGLPLAVTYFTARNSHNEREILRHIFPTAALQSIAAMAIYIVLVFILSDNDGENVLIAGLITSITIPSMVIQQYALAVLQGTHRFAAFNVLRLLPALVYAVALTVVFILRVGELSEVAAGWTASNVGAAVLTLVVAVRGASFPYGHARLPSLREMLRFGVKGFLGAASPLVTFRLDQAGGGVFLSPSALGIYVVGAAFTNLPSFVAL